MAIKNPRISVSKTAAVTPKRKAYLRAKADYDKYFDVFHQARLDYRARKISDEKYLAIRHKFDKIVAEFDAAEFAYRDAREGLKKNPVKIIRTKSVTVRNKMTGETGEAIGRKGGFVKVQWSGRARPTLIAESEIVKANPAKKYKSPSMLGTTDKVVARTFAYGSTYSLHEHSNGLYSITADGSALGPPKAKDLVIPEFEEMTGIKVRESVRRNPARESSAFQPHAPVYYLEARYGEKTRAMPSGLIGIVGVHANSRIEALRLGRPKFIAEYGQPTTKFAITKEFEYKPSGVATEKAKRRHAKRGNPTVREQSEMFQGKASGRAVELKAANGTPANLARVGKLAGLKLSKRRAELKIPGAVVGLDTKGRLWITGTRCPLINTKAKPGQGLDYGEIDTIAYVTAKAHIGDGKTFEYVHKFGEEGGKKPHLIIDDEGMPLIKGGSYRVEDAGIID